MNFGEQNRMRCKAASAPQCEHCKHEPTQQRAGYGSQKHIYFGASTYHADAAARARKAIETEMLTAEHLWVSFQKEAEAVVLANGLPIGDLGERNRRINAAYAKLWLADHRFQWAGLAAFASKQVGCACCMPEGW